MCLTSLEDIKNSKAEIETLAENPDLRPALDLLKAFAQKFDPTRRKEATILVNRWNTIRSNRRLGVGGDHTAQIAALARDIVELTDDISLFAEHQMQRKNVDEPVVNNGQGVSSSQTAEPKDRLQQNTQHRRPQPGDTCDRPPPSDDPIRHRLPAIQEMVDKLDRDFEIGNVEASYYYKRRDYLLTLRNRGITTLCKDLDSSGAEYLAEIVRKIANGESAELILRDLQSAARNDKIPRRSLFADVLRSNAGTVIGSLLNAVVKLLN